MSRTEAAQDSSMEEILASIRRIISEDSVHGKDTPAELPRAATTTLSMRQAPLAPARAPLKEPLTVAPPALPDGLGAEPEDDILDLGATYASITRSPLPAPPPVTPAWSMPLAPQPFFAAPTPVAKTPPPFQPVVAEALSPPMAEPAPTLYTPPPLPQTLDPPEPAMAAVDAVPDVAMTSATESLAVEAAAPEIAASEPAAPMDEDTLATASEPIAGYIDMSAVELVPVETESAAIGEAPSVSILIPEPVVVAPEPVAEMPVVAMMQVALAAEPAAKRTLEDAVADMLKPMLQEWLDKNMPRIIEKAMAKN